METYLIKKSSAWFIGQSELLITGGKPVESICIDQAYELQFIPMPIATRVHGGQGELTTLTNLVPVADHITIFAPDAISAPLDSTSKTLTLYNKVIKAVQASISKPN